MGPIWRFAAVALAFVVLAAGCVSPSTNQPPSITSSLPKTDWEIPEDTSISFSVWASDPDGQKLACRWYIDGVLNTTSDPPVHLNSSSGWQFSFTYKPGPGAGNHTVKAVVSDGALSASRGWKIGIYEVNHPPVISNPIPASTGPSVTEGGEIKFRAEVLDPDGDPVNVTWLVDERTAASGAAVFIFRPGFAMAGLHAVRLKASDGNASSEKGWNVTVVNVNRPPAIFNDTPAADPRLAEMDTVRFHAEGQDDDGDAVALCWTLDGAPAGGGKDFVYTPDHQSEGHHVVAVTASDGTLQALRAWNVSVDNLNRAPEIVSWSPPGDISVAEWETTGFSLQGIDVDGDPLQVAWHIDGGPAPDASGARYNYTAGFNSTGNHTVRAVLSDGNASRERVWNVSVRRAASNWTVLAYLNGDNDLEPFIMEDINEMETAGSTQSVNIVAQLDRHPSYDASSGDWQGARRYRVERDADSAGIGSRMLEDIGEVDMGAEATLRDFLLWGAANFPSGRLMVVMSGHGDGWPGISQDFSSGNDRLSASSVASAMAALAAARGAPADVMELDVCYWAMLETAWGLNGSVRYMVASEDIDPSPGQSWGPLLGGLGAKPSMTPAELASAAVASFAAAYSETMASPEDNATFTQSALDIPGLAALASGLDGLCDALGEDMGAMLPGITAARQAVRSFGKPEYIDIYDLARLLRQNSSSDALNASAQAVMDAVAGAVVSESHGKDRQGSHGISIYFPAYSYAFRNEYRNLSMSSDVGWLGLLQAYYNATGRAAGGPVQAGGPADGASDGDCGAPKARACEGPGTRGGRELTLKGGLLRW